jgi:uncharacterized membrane protein YbhN (UPF0104 family)
VVAESWLFTDNFFPVKLGAFRLEETPVKNPLSDTTSWTRLVATGAVSVLLLGTLFWFVDIDRLFALLKQTNLAMLSTAGVAYLGVIGMRWLRVGAVTESQSLSRHRLELLWTVSGHSFANQVLPARSGELVFPYLWSRATNRNYADAAVLLAAIRIIELGVLAILYSVGLLTWLAGGLSMSALLGIGGALLVGFALLGFTDTLLEYGVRLCDRLFEFGPVGSWELLEGLKDWLAETERSVEKLSVMDRAILIGFTAAMWILMFTVFYFLLGASGELLAASQTVAGSAGGIIGNLIPVGIVGSVGPMEAGWTAGFTAVGATLEPVVAAAVLLRALILVANGIVAAFSRGITQVLKT